MAVLDRHDFRFRDLDRRDAMRFGRENNDLPLDISVRSVVNTAYVQDGCRWSYVGVDTSGSVDSPRTA